MWDNNRSRTRAVFSWIMLFAAAIALVLPEHCVADDALSFPPTSGPLMGNPNPAAFDTGGFGILCASGALSALALWQSNPVASDRSSLVDLSNAELFLEKADGWLQFFVQAGAYSLPSLGTSYLTAGKTPRETFGYVPVAFVKLAPDEHFSIQAGKLSSLIGAESAFTFENLNIERGLLWNQTSSVSRGVQFNYANGPLTVSVSWNDGYYSGRFNWLTALVSYALDDGGGTVTLVGGANLGHTGYSDFATPLAQNNSAVFDLMYTGTVGRWTLTPYVQISRVPRNPTFGFAKETVSEGAALLASCKLDEGWAVAARGEYLDTHGAANLAYGAGSAAWSLTLTPTYQRGVFYARAEASYVGLIDAEPGLAFGRRSDSASQARLMLETGVLF